MSERDQVRVEIKLAQEGRDSVGELGYFLTRIENIYSNVLSAEDGFVQEAIEASYEEMMGRDDGVWKVPIEPILDLDSFLDDSNILLENSDHTIDVQYVFNKNPTEVGLEGDPSLYEIIKKILHMLKGEEDLDVYKENDEESGQLIIRIENDIDIDEINGELREIESESD